MPETDTLKNGDVSRKWKQMYEPMQDCCILSYQKWRWDNGQDERQNEKRSDHAG